MGPSRPVCLKHRSVHTLMRCHSQWNSVDCSEDTYGLTYFELSTVLFSFMDLIKLYNLEQLVRVIQLNDVTTTEPCHGRVQLAFGWFCRAPLSMGDEERLTDYYKNMHELRKVLN